MNDKTVTNPIHVSTNRKSSRVVFTAMSIAAAFSAAAQTDTLQGVPQNATITTANKIEQKQSQTGKVVSVITTEQLRRSVGKTVAQVLNEQAGITIAGAFNTTGSVQSVFIRGANYGRTLILLDGIPVNDPSELSNSYDLNLLSINDVEQIEVCRGAQSTLYGSDAVAGVINIITSKKDIRKPFNLKLTAAAGNFSTFKNNVQVYGKAGKLTYSARYAQLHTNGFSAAYDSTGKKNFDRDGYTGNLGHITLGYQLTSQLQIRAFGMFSAYKAGIDGSAFVDDKDYTIRNKSLNTGGGFLYKNDVVSVTGNFQYTDANRRYLNDSGFVSGFSKFERNEYYGKSQFAELYASIKLGSGFSLLQGSDFRRHTMNNNYLSISSFGPYAPKPFDSSASQASLYGSLLYNSTNNKLNVELGGRLNVHSRYGSNYTYTFNPSYNINQNLRIFGSISTGFKAPTLYQLYALGGIGNRNLQPEKSKSFELGIQKQLKGFTSRLVGFFRDIKNGIDYNNVINTYFNFQRQKVGGFEYEASAQVAKHLTITANYTFLDSKEHSQSRINFKDTSYTYLLRRPKHNVNFTVGYQFTPGLLLNVGGKYVSKRYDVGGYQVADLPLSDYFILNAYAEYKIPKYDLRFFANAQNLLDKKNYFDLRGYSNQPFMLIAGFSFTL